MKVYFIRHAEAEHNATLNWRMFDPPITANGVDQCVLAFEKGIYRNIDMVFVSTSQRALQTATILFPETQIYASDLFLEHNTGVECNLRSSLDIQRQRFPRIDFDKYYVSPLNIETTRDATISRARNIIETVKSTKLNTIAVVTHGNIIGDIANVIDGTYNVHPNNCEAYICNIY